MDRQGASRCFTALGSATFGFPRSFEEERKGRVYSLGWHVVDLDV